MRVVFIEWGDDVNCSRWSEGWKEMVVMDWM